MRDDGDVVTATLAGVDIIGEAGDVESSIEYDAAVRSMGTAGSGAEYAVLNDGSVLLVGIDGGTTVVVDLEAQVADVEPSADGVIVVTRRGRIANVSLDPIGASFVEDFLGAPINDVAVSVDDRVAFATQSGIVELRRLDALGEAPIVLSHPEGNVDSVAFAVDGEQVFTGVAQRRASLSFDDTFSVWDTETGARLANVGGEAEDVPGCAFFDNVVRVASDGAVVAVTSHDFTVSLVDAATAAIVHTFPPHGSSVLDVAISNDSSLLVTSSDDADVAGVGHAHLRSRRRARGAGRWILVTVVPR